MTFPYQDDLLCLSISSETDIDKIRDEILVSLLKLNKKL